MSEVTHLLSTDDWLPEDGILPASDAQPDYRLIGINLEGQFYFYGPTPEEPGEVVPALMGLVCDVAITRHGTPGSRGGTSWQGQREHLTLRLLPPSPTVHNVLRLPAHRGQWHYRSLLGALLELDLRSTPVKIEPRPGRSTTFIQVATDAKGINVVKAEPIGPDIDDLEIAVDRIRRGLGLPDTTSYLNV